MSITGPGCERCNKGLVNWQEQPYVRERDGLDYKPCDHCGGLSQFKRDRCVSCGNHVQQGTHALSEHRDDCALRLEWERDEKDAARAREADAITRAVATGAFVCWSGDRQRTECLHCNAEIAMPADKTVHATGCAYARAVAYVESRHPPTRGGG